MTKAHLSAACAVLLLAAAGARAQAPSVPAVAIELSRFVLSEETWNRMEQGIGEQTQQHIAQNLAQRGMQVPPDFGPRFTEEFRRLISYREILELQAALLAKHYTVPELRQLLAFYKTPLGRKVIRVMPEVMQDVNGRMLLLVQERMPAMIERLRPTLERSTPATPPSQPPAPPSPPAAPPSTQEQKKSAT
jgi:hypothetical protein